jgi:hypothetical protein
MYGEISNLGLFVQTLPYGLGLLQTSRSVDKKLVICEIGIVLKLNVIGEFVVTWIYINYNVSLREPNEKNITKRIHACSIDREEKCRAGNRKCCRNIFIQSRPARANHGPRAKLVHEHAPPSLLTLTLMEGIASELLHCNFSACMLSYQQTDVINLFNSGKYLISSHNW